MEAGKCAQQPPIWEGKWQNQVMPLQVCQLVLSTLHENKGCQKIKKKKKEKNFNKKKKKKGKENFYF